MLSVFYLVFYPSSILCSTRLLCHVLSHLLPIFRSIFYPSSTQSSIHLPSQPYRSNHTKSGITSYQLLTSRQAAEGRHNIPRIAPLRLALTAKELHLWKGFLARTPIDQNARGSSAPQHVILQSRSRTIASHPFIDYQKAPSPMRASHIPQLHALRPRLPRPACPQSYVLAITNSAPPSQISPFHLRVSHPQSNIHPKPY